VVCGRREDILRSRVLPDHHSARASGWIPARGFGRATYPSLNLSPRKQKERTLKAARTEARELLAPVYGWFTKGFDTPILKDSMALLAELQ
jgi:hypothetical protein